MDDKEDLITSLHAFVLGQHMEAMWKTLRSCGNHYNLVEGGTGTMLADIM